MTPFQRALILNHGLTTGEAEAAELVAQGLTRSKACKRLSISHMAMQARMGEAYKKLGFTWPKYQLEALYRAEVSRVGGGVLE